MGGPLIRLLQALSQDDWQTAAAQVILMAVILLLAFPLHELAHALVADHFGDPTPRYAGRITLNPFKHLSPLGSLMFVLAGIGWATTPVNSMNFRGDYRAKTALVALAGPAMNLLVAFIFALVYRVLMTAVIEPGTLPDLVVKVCVEAVRINLILALFNLIPIPPLDGGTVLVSFASDGVRALFMQIGQYGFIILVLLSQTNVLNVLVMAPALSLARRLLGY